MKTSSTAPAVSVIIPTYGHAHTVLVTIESVFAQTFQDFEIIVVNDGSPDDTAEKLAPLAAAGRIRYIAQANGGQAVARNRGLTLAAGRYIAFLDDDDLWPRDKLAWQVQFLENNERYGVVGGPEQFISETGAFLPGAYPCASEEISFEALFSVNPFRSPGQTLIRADLAHRLGGFDASIWGADDWDFWMRAATLFPIFKDARLALHYRFHGQNASQNSLRMLWNCHAVLQRHLPHVSSARRRARRVTAYRWLYTYCGSGVAQSFLEHLLSVRLRLALRDLHGLAIFFPIMGESLTLCREIGWDLLRLGFRTSRRLWRQKFAPR